MLKEEEEEEEEARRSFRGLVLLIATAVHAQQLVVLNGAPLPS